MPFLQYIENLDPLANLQILSIAHNMIEKMERMDKLMNLQILDLSDNLLRKIEGIENLHQLTILNLEDNQIESIPVFIGKKLKCLRTFKIARNQLKSVSDSSLIQRGSLFKASHVALMLKTL